MVWNLVRGINRQPKFSITQEENFLSAQNSFKNFLKTFWSAKQLLNKQGKGQCQQKGNRC